jgi:hypothetical protein
VVAAFAVLGLSSLGMNPRPPVPPFWVANFMYKPNHGIAYALAAAAFGICAARGRAWALALALGALAWVSLVAWAYVLVGLLAGAVLQPAADRRWKPVLGGIALSALAAAPYVFHLTRDYAPTGSSATARHMWTDPNALLLAVPNWSTIDLGLSADRRARYGTIAEPPIGFRVAAKMGPSGDQLPRRNLLNTCSQIARLDPIGRTKN